jgi:hypothetical protein
MTEALFDRRLLDTRPHACAGAVCQVCALDRAREAGLSASAPGRNALARRKDPSTSKAAAQAVERESILRALLTQFARADLTAEEAAAQAGLDERSGYWKRVSDLQNAGHIETIIVDGEPLTRTGSSGRQQRVLRVTMAGSDALFTS